MIVFPEKARELLVTLEASVFSTVCFLFLPPFCAGVIRANSRTRINETFFSYLNEQRAVYPQIVLSFFFFFFLQIIRYVSVLLILSAFERNKSVRTIASDPKSPVHLNTHNYLPFPVIKTFLRRLNVPAIGIFNQLGYNLLARLQRCNWASIIVAQLCMVNTQLTIIIQLPATDVIFILRYKCRQVTLHYFVTGRRITGRFSLIVSKVPN